ncbi:MAG: thiol-disulfide oxidoreductase DCC family protein [Pseudomonadota bacterium]|nr:thiol-disulfide oxidoreductase DCC family protein [Pseudomonadota bacterium]
MVEIPRDRPIIVFDGICVLCTANAQFVLRSDRRGRFRLAAMQDDAGAQLMRENGIDPSDPESFILIDAVQDGGRVWKNSDAVLHMWNELGWPWRIGSVFRLVPRFIRDPIYLLIARNRYKWFGQREECWVPSMEQAERIL